MEWVVSGISKLALEKYFVGESSHGSNNLTRANMVCMSFMFSILQRIGFYVLNLSLNGMKLGYFVMLLKQKPRLVLLF
jgi:hypothetical protein